MSARVYKSVLSQWVIAALNASHFHLTTCNKRSILKTDYLNVKRYDGKNKMIMISINV